MTERTRQQELDIQEQDNEERSKGLSARTRKVEYCKIARKDRKKNCNKKQDSQNRTAGKREPKRTRNRMSRTTLPE